MPHRLNLALILGSNRQPRLCDPVAAWANTRVEDADASLVVTPEYNLPRAWERFDADGVMLAPAAADQAARAMLSQLHWRARALHETRRQAPYRAMEAA